MLAYILEYLPTNIHFPLYLVSYTFAGLLILFIVFYLNLFFKEISYYISINQWNKTPGVSAYYKIFNGLMYFYPNSSSNDQADSLSKLIRKEKDSKLIAFNWPGLPYNKVQLVLTDPVIINDFMRQENDCTIRDNQEDYAPQVNLGFVQMSGKEGLHKRGFFGDFFIYDRIRNLSEPMHEMFNVEMKNQIKLKGITKERFVKINLKEFVMPTFYKWMSLLLFGYNSEDDLYVD